MIQEQDLELIVEESAVVWRRWAVVLAGVIVLLAGAYFAFSFLTGGEEADEVEATIEEVSVERGSLTNILETTGSASARRQSDLIFLVAGTVESVEVGLGDTVSSGQVLGQLNERDTRRDLETAEAKLEQERLRLDQLMEPPTNSELASAQQSIASAHSQAASAQISLDNLEGSPSLAKIASADAAVQQARASLEQVLAGPTAADIASADAAVEKAKASLEELLAAPTAANIASADAAVEQARLGLEVLVTPPSLANIADADASIAQAESSLASSARLVATSLASLSEAVTSYCQGRFSVTLLCDNPVAPLSDEQSAALNESVGQWIGNPRGLPPDIPQLLQADAAYRNAVDSEVSARAGLDSVLQRRAELNGGPTEQELKEARATIISAVTRREELDEPPAQHELDQAQASLDSALKTRAELDEPPLKYELDQARASLNSALTSRAELDEPPTQSEINQAKAAVDSAEAALQGALADGEALMEGPSESVIRIEEQSVRLLEISLQVAQDRLDDLALEAPYDGIVASIGVVPGDRANSSLVAFVVMDPTSIGVELNVSESDLVGLRPGQLAVARFDSIPDDSYFLEITGINTIPTVTSGVVTYMVQAEMVAPGQLQGRADEVQAIAGLVRGGPPAGEVGDSGAGDGGGLGGRQGGAAQECIQRVLGRTPSGRGDISSEERQRIQEECFGGGSGQRGQATAGGRATGPLPQPSEMPTPGMNASVSVLIDIKSNVLLVPSEAIRRQGTAAFVFVPTPDGGIERQAVTVGGTDGDVTEILNGLAEGEKVLIGAGLTALQSGRTDLRPFRQIQ